MDENPPEIIMEGNGNGQEDEHEPDPELIFDEDLSNVFTTETQDEGGHIDTEDVVEIESEQVTEPTPEEIAAAEAQAQAEADAVASINIQMDGVDVDMDITDDAIPAHEFLITADGNYLPQTGENMIEVELSPEDELRSNEKLDRSSPDLWPTNLSTTAKQLLYNNQIKTGETDSAQSWAQGLDPEDINLLHQFGSLTSSSLVDEVKKLSNIAYQLSLDEKKEMTRGKLLRVLGESHSVMKDTDHGKRRWK